MRALVARVNSSRAGLRNAISTSVIGGLRPSQWIQLTFSKPRLFGLRLTARTTWPWRASAAGRLANAFSAPPMG